jgi:hypothetical protein
MQLFTVIFERIPIVWFLLGLLFNSVGLYLGFEYTLAFGYMIVGWFFCAYGLALFFFRLRERSNTSTATRLSRNFVSIGSGVKTPAIPNAENEQTIEASEAE